MLTYPQIDPIIFQMGPLRVGWYGLMYVLAYVVGIYQLKRFIRRHEFGISFEDLENLTMYIFLGMVLGARTFYVFIYNWDHYSLYPEEILQVWKGGLSFHGAFVGILLGMYLFSKRYQFRFFHIADHVATAAPIGLFFGRIGHFINGELYGRVTDSPLGMIFPGAGPLPRHPSQLYQGLSEGLLLWIILNLSKLKKPREGVQGTIFVTGYALFRFIMEFFREPDAQLGLYFNFFTMGQILNSLMILAALGLWIWVLRRPADLFAAIDQKNLGRSPAFKPNPKVFAKTSKK